MKRLGVCLLGLALLVACKTPPTPEADPYPDGEAFEEQEEAPKPGASFTVSKEVYDYTFAEVKLFVDELNAIIQKKNYNGWKNALSEELFARISSPEFLASASNTSMLKTQKIVLKTPNDYFLNVVVPSRSNSKVDEIEFTAMNRVKVFFLEERRKTENNTVKTEFRRLRLYELIKIGDTWKVID